jgi:HlyD family secretion protein
MRKRWWVAAGGVVVIIAAGVVVIRRGPAPVSVDVQPVARKAVLRAIATASGEIVATRYADIGATAMGRIVSLPVVEGAHVRRGQLLARIDPVQAETQAAAAGALLDALRAEERATAESVATAIAARDAASARARETALALNRSKELRRGGFSAQSEVDAAQAASDSAEAQLRAASADVTRAQRAADAASRRVAQAVAEHRRSRDVLAKTEIVSPMDGIVTRLNVREGETVVVGIQNQPGTTLMTVSDLAAVNAEVKVAEADVLRLEVGHPAVVTLEAAPGRTWRGHVAEIGASALPQANPGAAAREFRVVVRIDDDASGLRPGLTCDAEIVTAEQRQVLAVPLQAVVLRGAEGTEKRGVFVAEDGVAKFMPVSTGTIGGLEIAVGGIAERTPVIVGPFQALRTIEDGTRVKARQPVAAKP